MTPTSFLVRNWPVPFRHTLRVVGSMHALGDWNPTAGVKLEWTEGDNWRGTASLPAGPVFFKASSTLMSRLNYLAPSNHLGCHVHIADT